MGCLYCGKEIGPIQLLKGSDFCSSAHRKRYGERLSKALIEISRPEPTPPTAGFLDALKSDSGGFRREARSAIFAGIARPLEFPRTWRIEIAPLLGSQPRRLDCPPESRACSSAVADASRLAAVNAPPFAVRPATEGLPSGLARTDAPPSKTTRAAAAAPADNWLTASAQPATREVQPREIAALAARTAPLSLNGALRLPNAETAGRTAPVAHQWLMAGAQAAAREVQPSGFSALLARMAPPSSDRLLSISFPAVSAQERVNEYTPAAASHWLAACAEAAAREILPLASSPAFAARATLERPSLDVAAENPFERAMDPQTAPGPIADWRWAPNAQPAYRAGIPETEVVDIRRQSDLRLTRGLKLGIANPRMSASSAHATLPAPEAAAREVQACAAPAMHAAQPIAKPALPSFAALPIRLVTDLPTAPGADLSVAAAVAGHAPLTAERARRSRPRPQTLAFGLSPDFEAVAEDPVSCRVADLLPLEYHPHRVRASHTATLEWMAAHHTPHTPALLVGIPADELEKHLLAQPPKRKPEAPAPVVTMPSPAAPAKKYDRWRAAGAVAAGLFVGMVVWGGANAVRIGTGMAVINRDVSAPAGPTSTAVARSGAAAKIAPKSTPSKGAMAWVRSAAAKRAAVDLTDSFRGMEAWGMPAKTWAPGWSRHPDGYVRPGQLAIFNPSREYQNYRLEFLAQVESKSMGWAVRAKDDKNYYAMKFTVVEPGLRPVIAMVHYPVIGGKPGRRTEVPLSVMIHRNEPYRVSVEVKGNRMVTSVEGQEVDTWTDNKLASGGIGFFSEAGERARLYWMKVAVNDDFIGRICAYFTAPETTTASTFRPDLTFPQLLAWDTGARTKRPQYPELIQLGRLGTM